MPPITQSFFLAASLVDTRLVSGDKYRLYYRKYWCTGGTSYRMALCPD